MRTRTSTSELMPVVGFATRGLSIRTLLIRLKGEPLSLPVAIDIALSVVRLVRAEHDAGRVVGALDDSRVVLMENGMISFMAGGDRLAPELKKPAAQATAASDVFAVGAILSRLIAGAPSDDDSPATLIPDLPLELTQLMDSCLSTDPKMRPSQIKWVEKALAQLVTEEQSEAALEERIALVKQNTPEVARTLPAEESRVIATEDVQSRVMLRPAGRAGLLYGGLVFGLLLVGGLWWLMKPSSTAAPAPAAAAATAEPAPEEAPAAAAPAPAEDVAAPAAPAAAEPEVAPPSKPEPLAAKAAPPAAKAKKHRRR